ncbi:TPA: hypothetical protein EYP66_25660 [Candidatus Poribacteria bacterium]|nr:hypothetical protein [Candidatus Poribacteria bacterium]
MYNKKMMVVMPFIFFLLCSLTISAQGQDALGFSQLVKSGFWIEEDGHGEYDPHNSYAYSMAWFKDKLYVGTNRDMLALRKLQDELGRRPLPEMDPFPVDYIPDDPFWHDDNPANGVVDEGEGLDTRAQIWRYTPDPENPETGEWERVHRADWVEYPAGGPDTYVAEEIGYRNMIIFEEPDGTEALYVSTFIAAGNGARLLRTETGNPGDWEVASNWFGLTPGTITAIRGLASFKGKLYAATAGPGSFDVRIYESPDGFPDVDADTPWRPVCPEAFDDPHNKEIYELCVFNGYLYAATLNPYPLEAGGGFQIWKTAAESYDPIAQTYQWTKVIDKGAYRGNLNETVTSMYVFKNKLYVGGAVQGGGIDLTFEDDPEIGPVGPGTAELLYINPDDTWEIVCGDEREIPSGEIKVPKIPSGPGFGDFFTGYFWRIRAHKVGDEEWLYVGTMDNSIFTKYILMDEMNDLLYEWLTTYPDGPEAGIQYIIEKTGGFDLWKSQNGEDDWYPINFNGFGTPLNYGVRTLQSTPYGLFLGTANPFTDDAPEGGCQVWLGTPGAINPPDNLQANFGEHEVKLRWWPSEAAVMYRIIRHTAVEVTGRFGETRMILSPPPPEPIGVTTETFYVDNTVEPGKAYAYYIKTDTGTGISGPSNVRMGIAKDIFFPVIPGRFVFKWDTRLFVQTITVINNTPAPLKADVPLVLEGLTPNVILVNQDGRAKNGSPYVHLPQIPGIGGSVQITLKFKDPMFAPIKYVPFVVFGRDAEP